MLHRRSQEESEQTGLAGFPLELSITDLHSCPFFLKSNHKCIQCWAKSLLVWKLLCPTNVDSIIQDRSLYFVTGGVVVIFTMGVG